MISFIKRCFNLAKRVLIKCVRKVYRKIKGWEWCVIHDNQPRYVKAGAKLWLENHKFFVEIGGITLGGGCKR